MAFDSCDRGLLYGGNVICGPHQSIFILHDELSVSVDSSICVRVDVMAYSVFRGEDDAEGLVGIETVRDIHRHELSFHTPCTNGDDHRPADVLSVGVVVRRDGRSDPYVVVLPARGDFLLAAWEVHDPPTADAARTANHRSVHNHFFRQ